MSLTSLPVFYPNYSTESGAQRGSRGLSGRRTQRLESEVTGTAEICGMDYRRLGKCTEREHQESLKGFPWVYNWIQSCVCTEWDFVLPGREQLLADCEPEILEVTVLGGSEISPSRVGRFAKHPRHSAVTQEGLPEDSLRTTHHLPRSKPKIKPWQNEADCPVY